MEIDIDKIFERADIKHIREFLIGESVIFNDYDGTYQSRLDRNSEDIFYALKRLSKDDEKQLGEATDDLILALMTYRDVYSEIGMKIGARIMFQLLYENE